MIKIYLTEEQISLLNDDSKKEEITFYEFVVSIKQFLKDLIKKPGDAKPSDLLMKLVNDKSELVKKMKDIGLIKSSERIDEVPVEEDKHPYGKKLVAKRFITYTIPKARFSEKLKQLYNDIVDNDNLVKEEGEGASSCGSVMQGGGTNPSAGQYDVPFKNVQRKNFWYSSLTRNKDKKNKSISVN